MIDETDIANALTDHLAGMADVPPVAWPNKDLPEGTARPYLVAQIVRVNRLDRTISGGHAESRGYMTVTVVADVDTWETSATQIADRVADRFPYGTRLTVPGGFVTVTKPPEVQTGFRDGPLRRLPVRIDYLAH